MHEYSAQDLKKLFKLPESLLRSLIKAGHVQPHAANGKTHYSFQDLLLLRTAAALRAAKVPSRKIHSALKKLRESLPENASLNGVSLAASGTAITVRSGSRQWDANTGQYALPLDADLESRPVRSLKSPAPPDEREELSQQHFDNAFSLEDDDPATAMGEYSKSLALNAEHVEARINLGRLLHVAGRFEEAEAVYRDGKYSHALLFFNLAVLLEDRGRDSDAIAGYRDALMLDPRLADAHFNLARLYENLGRTQDALRSLLAYRRLASAADD